MARSTPFTFHYLVQAGDLPASVQRVERAHSLGQVDVVGQGARKLHEQRVQRPEPVSGYGVRQAFEILVSISVETHFPGLFLGREGLERACAVEAAVRTVSRAGEQTVASGATVGP